MGEDATIEKRAYETCLYIHIVCNMNVLSSCQKICKWASANGGHELQAFAYFMTMMSAMVPDLLNYRENIKLLIANRERYLSSPPPFDLDLFAEKENFILFIYSKMFH